MSARGNARRAIFRDERDRRHYSIWFNRRHGRSGHLFQGRFKSVVVSPEEWGLELSRYLHLNPVRIGRLGLGKWEQQRIRAGAAERPQSERVLYLGRRVCGKKWEELARAVGLKE